MTGLETAVLILLIVSALFSILGVIGLFRFPDFYTRMHAAGLVSGFGLIFAAAGAIVYVAGNIAQNSGYTGFIFHIVFAVLLVFIAATTSTHVIARAAHKSGLKPLGAEIDALSEESP
ncbi:MAG TPA: monovalent cation/H(+) antiporter subunit G [Methanocorpusculum sp.]|nr:monovalent cation/H(+) antiporter subunit G [Methanocorpusculum sp.]